MQQHAAECKRNDNKYKKQRQHQNYFPIDRHLITDHHNDDYGERNHHFKSVGTYFYKNQYKLRYIYFRYNWFVCRYQLYALPQTGRKKVPAVIADKNKDRQIRFPFLKYDNRYERIYDHKQQRIQNPPHPAQMRVSHFGFQFGFCRIYGIFSVFFYITDKSVQSHYSFFIPDIYKIHATYKISYNKATAAVRIQDNGRNHTAFAQISIYFSIFRLHSVCI